MPTPNIAFKIAAMQAGPVFLNREATVEKACKLISEAGREDARLIVFPESFIPTYPDWVWAVPPGRGKILSQLYGELLANAVEIPSAATERLGRAAREAGAYVVMGVTERDTEASGASLYNTLIYFGPEGKVLGKHRKLVPTGGERLVWAQGDGSTLQVYDTPLGKLHAPGALHHVCLGNANLHRRHLGPRRAVAVHFAAYRQGRTGLCDRLLNRHATGRHSRPVRIQSQIL